MPPSPLNPSQLGLSGGEITGGVDARGGPTQYFCFLEDQLQGLQRATDGIFSANIRSDRDASEVNLQARNALQMADELDGDLDTQLNMWKTDSDLVSRLYDLKVSVKRIRARLKTDSQRILDDRGMQTADGRANVTRPKVFTGSGTPLDYLNWRKAAERYHAACRLSEEQQVKVREVRKKGRNNLHARNCRKRKADKTTELQVIEPIDLSGARRGKGDHQ